MKKILPALVVLLLPVAAFAGEKEVFVTNTVGVDLLSLPEDSLDLSSSHRQLDIDCSLDPTSSLCSTLSDPSATNPKLTHSVSLSLLADPGHRCSATLFVSDADGSGTVLRPLLMAHATEFSPGVVSLAFPRPIRLEARDAFTFVARDVDGQNDGCEATAIVGVELLLP